MEMDERKLIEMDLSDTIIGRYHGFSVGSRHFYLYPVTLGKMYLLGRLIEDLHVNYDIVKANPYVEMLRLSVEHKEVCCQILTYHTIHTMTKIFDNEFVQNRTKWFVENIDNEALAKILKMVMTDKTDTFMKHLGIDREQARMKRVMSVKQDKNSITFGGLSIFGSLIDSACERYGWTKEYVVWGIDYASLTLMLADKITSTYLTDEERKRLPASVLNKSKVINMDDPKNRDMVKQVDWR